MNKSGQNISVDVDSGNTAKVIVYGLVGVAVLAIGYFGIVKPILETLQIIDTKEEKKGKKDAARLSRKQVLSSSLYKKNRGKITISSGQAHEKALNIYNAKGYTWDDETKAVGSITSTGSLVNISYVAYTFYKIYGKSMDSYLSTFLEGENWTEIDKYISKTKKF